MRLSKLTLLDALYVVRNMRAEDEREAFASRDGEDRDALAAEIALQWGPYVWVALADDGTPTALIGATRQRGNCWCAWMIGTNRFDEIGKGLTKWVKHFMIPTLVGLGATRIEAYSIDGHPKAHRWLRFCGAVEEARLRRYGKHGEDFLVFVILPCA